MGKYTKIRTTITPGEIIKVEEFELLDLDRQGLIHSREGDDNWKGDEPVETDDKAPAKASTGKAAS